MAEHPEQTEQPASGGREDKGPEPSGVQRKTFAGVTKDVEGRSVVSVISSENEDRDGDVVEVRGIDLSHFRRNPIVLFQHSPSLPIARATDISLQGNQLVATAEFPPAGVSQKADEVLGLLKAGILNATSIGFMPKKNGWEWRDPENWQGGIRFRNTELLEFSFVSIPSNRDALVLQRSAGAVVGQRCVIERDGGQGLVLREVAEGEEGEGGFIVQRWERKDGVWQPTDVQEILPADVLTLAPPMAEPTKTPCDLPPPDDKSRGQRQRAVEVLRKRATRVLRG